MTNSRTALLVRVLVAAIALFASNSTVQAQEQLDDASLKSMLKNLGFEIGKEGKKETGQALYDIRHEHEGSTIWAAVSLGSTSQDIWVTVNFGNLSPTQDLPREILLQMLDANYQQANYVYFAYDNEARHLILTGAIPNHEVQPAQLKRLIDEAVERTYNTGDLWDPSKWKSASGSKPRPVRARQ